MTDNGARCSDPNCGCRTGGFVSCDYCGGSHKIPHPVDDGEEGDWRWVPCPRCRTSQFVSVVGIEMKALTAKLGVAYETMGAAKVNEAREALKIPTVKLDLTGDGVCSAARLAAGLAEQEAQRTAETYSADEVGRAQEALGLPKMADRWWPSTGELSVKVEALRMWVEETLVARVNKRLDRLEHRVSGLEQAPDVGGWQRMLVRLFRLRS